MWGCVNFDILPMITMSNWNMTQRGIQATEVGDMISICSSNSEHWGPRRYPVNISCFLGAMNDDVSNSTNRRHQHRKLTREVKKSSRFIFFFFFFRSNPTQRGYRKIMTYIWDECTRFQTTRQRVANQFRAIIKKDWFSELEILEIANQGIKTRILKNKNTLTEMNRKLITMETPYTQTTQNKVWNKKNEYRDFKEVYFWKEDEITNGKKTRLAETESINESLIHISTKNITELNELIYAGAKLVSDERKKN